MNSSSAMTKSPPAHRLISPLSAAWAPPLIAPMIEVVLSPPLAETKVSRPSEPCISRRTSWKKDITLRRPFPAPIPVYADYVRGRLHLAAPRATEQIILPPQLGAAGHFSA